MSKTKIIRVPATSNAAKLAAGLRALGATVAELDYGSRWELMGTLPSGQRLHLIPSPTPQA